MLEWTERRRDDVDPAGLARAVERVSARGGAAQLCVVRDGTVVLDRAIGCAPDDLFWIFSTSKPYTALLVHQLVERGVLDLDEPVAARWPEFAVNGKDAITVRHVLQHRSGIPVARSAVRDALAMADWDRSVRAVERCRPRFPAGAGPAYQYVSYGFVLGELLQRVTGTPLRELLRMQLLDPVGLRDTHLGLPPDQWRRHVPLRSRGAAGRATRAVLNRREVRQAVIPAGGISTTARDIAVLYQLLLCGGALGGVRLLRPSTVAAATTPTSDGTVDAFIRLPIRWSHGFQLGGPGLDPHRARPMGRRSSPLAFGHNGSNVCIAWADPTRRLVCVVLTDLLLPRTRAAEELCAVSDEVLAACPPD